MKLTRRQNVIKSRLATVSLKKIFRKYMSISAFDNDEKNRERQQVKHRSYSPITKSEHQTRWRASAERCASGSLRSHPHWIMWQQLLPASSSTCPPYCIHSSTAGLVCYWYLTCFVLFFVIGVDFRTFFVVKRLLVVLETFCHVFMYSSFL